MRHSLFLVSLLISGTASAASYYPANYPRHNLAEGKPATASSIGADGLPASAACDGTATNMWGSAISESTSWLEIDLGQVVTIDKARIDTWHHAKSFQIQVSTDDKNWTTAYSTTNGWWGMEINFPPVACRYFKLVFLVSDGGGEGYTVREVQVFAQGVPFDLPEFGFGYAQGKPSTSSSTVLDPAIGEKTPDLAEDTFFGTYWLNQSNPNKAGYDASPWWMVDLQAVKTIKYLRWATWECNFDYTISVSADGSTWSPVFTAGVPGKNQIEELTLPSPVETRYVKFETQAAYPIEGGYTAMSLRAVEVAGPEGWYVPSDSAAAPTISPAGGMFVDSVKVALASSPSSAPPWRAKKGWVNAAAEPRVGLRRLTMAVRWDSLKIENTNDSDCPAGRKGR